MSQENDKNRWTSHLPFFKKRETYEPWYDEKSDYNTNAKSYYDYLARFNHLIRSLVDFINRALDRNMNVEDTKSISFTKDGDWVSEDDCDLNKYDDLVLLRANVNISKATESKTLVNTNTKEFTISNATVIKDDGVWTPDYNPLLQEMDKEIGNLKKEITNLKNQNTELQSGLQKIINNLHESGAISNNDIKTYSFNSGRNIASGNINLFGGTQDGNSVIRTNKGKTENDITAGI